MFGRALGCGLIGMVLAGLLAGCGVGTAAAGDAGVAGARQAGTTAQMLTVDGRERTYALHLPPGDKGALPLVIVLHGFGGQGQGMVALTGMNSVADREGFVVAYPDGVARSWNDGRFSPDITAQRLGVDDVGFISALIDELVRTQAIDGRRVFVTGISNGGMMTERLGCELADKVAAIAPVAGPLSESLAPACAPARPLPTLLIAGTEDPLIPWAGGEVKGNGERGQVLSAADTVGRWVALDGCAPVPTVTPIPDRAPNDGTTTRRERYGGCRAGAEVALYAVVGGGHTWPGGLQYLPERTIGKTSRDFDASETIWGFFKQYPRP